MTLRSNTGVKYSVLVPVFNSEETLSELIARTRETLGKTGASYEIILVDDGSEDRSWEKIRALRKEHGDVLKGVRLTKNFGQHNALLCGLSVATGETIVTLDDDLQIPPEEITVLIEKFESGEFDLVYGCFKNKKHNWWRNAGSGFIRWFSRTYRKSAGKGSSFRIFSSGIAFHLLEHKQEFIYIDELLLWYTDRIGYTDVKHEKRKSRKSGYTPTKIYQLTFNLMIYYTALPLKWMVWGGFISSVLSFLIGIYYVVRKVFFHVPHGYTSIIVTILFSTSVIILSLGIIGEYLHRIYKVQNKKPMFTIREKI